MAVDSFVTIKGRQYPFYAPSASGGAFVQFNDTTAPYMAMLVRTFPAEFARALKALGYMLFKRTRQAMQAGGVGGTRWQELSGVKMPRRGWDRASSTRSANPNTGFFGHLYKAVGYRMDADNLRVQIGFLSFHAQDYARKAQEGFDTPITSKMRRQFNVFDRKLSDKGSIHTPARPLIEPVFRASLPEIKPFIEARIMLYLNRNSTFRKAA